jgi:protocatechuate 3,4-dioxygenase, alpha subunit
MLYATTSQTVGPYLLIGLEQLNRDAIAPDGVAGERVSVRGRVLDGNAEPVTDALIEIWQANAQGRYAHPEDQQEKPLDAGFKGFGRIPTDAEGRFRFATIKPGCVPGPAGSRQAPHLLVSVFARGMLKHATTRMYFPEEPANAEDPILACVPDARRATLIARAGATAGELVWEIVLQGETETVFFEL